MTAITPPASGPRFAALDGPLDPDASLRMAARGGAQNMVGAVIYAITGFALLIVLDRMLGFKAAGVVILAIAIFNICERAAEVGCGTGFVRWLSRHRALGRADLLRATVVIGLVPVFIFSSGLAVGLVYLAPVLAGLFAHDPHRVAGITSVLRCMAPFLPLTTVYNVILGGTRGFDTMKYQVGIEKIARGAALPVLAYVGAKGGMGPKGIGVIWAATNLVALVPAWIALRGLIEQAMADSTTGHAPVDRMLTGAFWRYTAPRAVGQVSDIIVNWLDTVLVGALVSTGAAAVYASGTRYMLPGQFTADALMQVSGPQISGLLSTDRTEEAGKLMRTISGWEVVLTWPVYFLVVLFPEPLLRVFGHDAIGAKWALIALSVAMMVTAPFGAVGAVILMSGRSRQAMGNALLLLVINVVGNLAFVPRYGLTAAGVTWAVTIMVANFLPAWQSYHSFRLSTLGRAGVIAAVASTATVGAPALAARILLGPTITALAIASIVGGFAFLVTLRLLREPLELTALVQGILPRRPAAASHQGGSAPRTPSGSRHPHTGGYHRPRPSRRKMNDPEPSFKLSDITGLIRRRIWIVALAVVVGLVGAAGLVGTKPPAYTATARVTVYPITADAFTSAKPTSNVDPTTEKNEIKSDQVTAVVKKQLGLAAGLGALESRVTVNNPTQSLIFDISYTATNPNKARDGANAFATAYLQQRQLTAQTTINANAANIDKQLTQATNDYANAVLAAKNSRTGSPANTQAQAKSLRAQASITALNNEKANLTGIDTTPGKLLKRASTPGRTINGTDLVTGVGLVAIFGLLGLAAAWWVDRKDPLEGGRRRVQRLAPAAVMRELPMGTARRPPDPALLDAAIDRLAVDLVSPDGSGRPTIALLVGTTDQAPAAFGEEIASSLMYAGVPAVFILAGPADREVRTAIPVVSFAEMMPNGQAARRALLPAPEHRQAVTWLRPQNSAESAGLVRRTVVDSLAERAAEDHLELVVYLAPSPRHSAVAAVLAQWVDRVVVSAEHPEPGAVEDVIEALLDVDVAPHEVVWS